MRAPESFRERDGESERFVAGPPGLAVPQSRSLCTASDGEARDFEGLRWILHDVAVFHASAIEKTDSACAKMPDGRLTIPF